jgi:hypothetical protein
VLTGFKVLLPFDDAFRDMLREKNPSMDMKHQVNHESNDCIHTFYGLAKKRSKQMCKVGLDEQLYLIF